MIVSDQPVVRRIKKLLNELKDSQYAQYRESNEFVLIHDYLEKILKDNKRDFRHTPEILFYVAEDLLDMDKDDYLPPCVVAFITFLFTQDGKEGNDDAINNLGELHYGGNHGFELNFKLAMQYYKKAAKLGNRCAQENLGYCYYYGRDGKPDYKKAFHYFSLGAFTDRLTSLYKIGDMYLNGLYVEKNEKEAFYIYQHCLDTMSYTEKDRVAGPVYLRLANMYLDGIGTKEKPRTALKYYQKAERYLSDMVQAGDAKYKRSLNAAIEGQSKAREKISKEFPNKEWKFDDPE